MHLNTQKPNTCMAYGHGLLQHLGLSMLRMAMVLKVLMNTADIPSQLYDCLIEQSSDSISDWTCQLDRPINFGYAKDKLSWFGV